ncbi:MAG: SURF1 family protein [Nitrosomonas sp.]|nr:SURF1 family protein [Nitrosomonas sp.]
MFVELGKWQLSRAEEKNTQYEQITLLSKEPAVTLPSSLIKFEDFQYREIEVRGVFQPKYTIYVDNKTYKGNAGYHVLTPIKISNSSLSVIINRGWVATGTDRAVLPEFPVVNGEIVIKGLAVSPELRMLELSEHITTGLVWDNFDLQRYHETTGLDLQPVMVLQKDELDDGLIRDWERPNSGADRNLGYAFQWFSLAITAIVIFLVLNVKRANKRTDSEK